MTRIGDAAPAVGLLVIYTQPGHARPPGQISARPRQLAAGLGGAGDSGRAALLLGGAVGKSAQLPLQTWLPDAMAGPTPVSALIHAATMVTAGVYLIARTHVLFTLAPPVQLAVAIIGAATLLLAGCSALTQHDIKRVLAYSTISQIGYMFLALGVGAWSAAIFHFMTHAFFKALLFLGAGVVIAEIDDEHDMFKMGGLRRELPVTFWTFLVGSASLAALPVVTAGFYSKDLILFEAWSSVLGGAWLWLAGLAGALLTSVYTFRMVFLTFFGDLQRRPTGRSGWRLNVPLVVLALLAVVGGFVELPSTLGDKPYFSISCSPCCRPSSISPHAPLSGALADRRRNRVAGRHLHRLGTVPAPPGRPRQSHAIAGAPGLHRFWSAGWGFDRLYDVVFVQPLIWFATVTSATGSIASTTDWPGAPDGMARAERDRNRTGSMVRGRPHRRRTRHHHDRHLLMILIWLVVVPFVAGVVAWVVDRWSHRWPRWIALAGISIDLAMAIALWIRCVQNRATAGRRPMAR